MPRGCTTRGASCLSLARQPPPWPHFGDLAAAAPPPAPPRLQRRAPACPNRAAPVLLPHSYARRAALACSSPLKRRIPPRHAPAYLRSLTRSGLPPHHTHTLHARPRHLLGLQQQRLQQQRLHAPHAESSTAAARVSTEHRSRLPTTTLAIPAHVRMQARAHAGPPSLLSLAPASTPPPQAPYPLAYPAPSAPSVRTSTVAAPHAQTTPIRTPATARTAAATMSGARRSVCATMPATCPPPHAALYTADGVCCNKSLETALYTAMPPRASAAGQARIPGAPRRVRRALLSAQEHATAQEREV